MCFRPLLRFVLGCLSFQSILKQTKPDADSISNLEKAIAAIHESVIRGSEKWNTLRLVYLDRLLDFGKMKVASFLTQVTKTGSSLLSNLTECLFLVAVCPSGCKRAFLLRQGPMRQRNVDQFLSSVYLHLFNDLLVISSKKYWFQHAGFTVMDHAEFPRHVKVEHVQTELLGVPPDSFLLHLYKSHTGQPTTMKLAAETRSDTEVWMKLLGVNVLMPQVLRQAVEERGHIPQSVTDLPPHTQHWYAPRLLEVPHVSLCHVTVHEKNVRGYLVPTTNFTTRPTGAPVHLAIWFDRSSKEVLSVKENRKRTASTCSLQAWRQE
ncbi:hypothetical protein F7725_016928, partial [Dissostichus mawsoni]